MRTGRHRDAIRECCGQWVKEDWVPLHPERTSIGKTEQRKPEKGRTYVVVHTFNPTAREGGRGRWVSVSGKASLVYYMDSRTARAVTQ